MRAFIVTAADRPGSAAEILGVVASAGVDLRAVTGVADGQTGMVALIPEDEEACRRALAGTDHRVVETELEVTEVERVQGAAARLALKLADGGVNLMLMTAIGMDGDRVQVAIGATDHARLKSALA
jgi:hypothetical protein